jgi:hypothetical protein
MGETGLAGFFVFRAHMIPHVESDDGGFVVLVDDHRKSIVEDELLKRDVDILGLNRDGWNSGKNQGSRQQTCREQRAVQHISSYAMMK